jgi:N-acetyl-gamma-glutamylphosphate reductase
MSHYGIIGVIGGSGFGGRNYIRLTDNHPWYEFAHVRVSSKAARKNAREAKANRGRTSAPFIRKAIVTDASKPASDSER